MSRKYKFRNPEAVYFVTFTTVNWIDVFTRLIYKEIIVDSLNYCIKNKGLMVYAWVIMSNHVHLVIESRNAPLEDIMRDLKKHTSKKIIKAIEENP
jgi:REP element-mobilizing transposase RayT